MQESPPTEQVSAREFVERELRARPDLTFNEVQERASKQGLAIPRFLYGSTRRALGLPPRPPGADIPAAQAPDTRPSDDLPTGDSSGQAEDASAATEPEAEPEPQPEAAGATKATEPENPQKGRGFAFAVETLRMSPDISFQDMKARARLAGLDVPPIVYGRAKALLGLVPVKPRRTRAAPRMLRQVDSAEDARLPSSSGARTIDQLVQMVRQLETERQRLRDTLAAVRRAVEEALTEPE